MELLTELFIEAGTLMFAGMVFVFAFLGLLVVFINTVLTPLSKKYPDPVAQVSSRPANKKVAPASTGVTNEVVAAISAAVTQYRQQHK